MSNKRFPAPFSPTKDIPGLTPTFNPKKYTEQCRNPAPKRKLPTGPFIDHCNDTYTGGVPLEIHMKRQAQIQMSKRTVRNLKASRAIMLILRVFLLLGCIGLLVLLISMRNIDVITGWITRVPPAVTSIHCLYSIYHYARSSRERTPGSSASYAMFACATDCCLIPFFVLSCLYAKREMGLIADNADKLWVSVIGPPDWITKLVFSIFILACTAGGITVTCLLLGLFIAVTYRRIAKLPPDLNPLDDRAFMGMLAKADAKRWSQSSVDSIDKEKPQRQIPFLQTRTKNGSVEWEYSQPLVDQDDGFNDYERSSRRNTFISESSKRVSVHQRVSSEDQYGDRHAGGFSNNGTMTLGAAADARTPTMRTTISSNGVGATTLPTLPPTHKKTTSMSAGNGNNANGGGNAWWNGNSVQQHPRASKRNTIHFATATSMGSPTDNNNNAQFNNNRPVQRAETFNAGLDRPSRNSHQYPPFDKPAASITTSEIPQLQRTDSGNTGKISRQKTASKHKSFTGITARLPIFNSRHNGSSALSDDDEDNDPQPRRGFYAPIDNSSGTYADDDDDNENWTTHGNDDDDDYKFHQKPTAPSNKENKKDKNTYYFDDGETADHHHDYVDPSFNSSESRAYGNDDVEIDADVLAHAVHVRMESMNSSLPKIKPLNTSSKKPRPHSTSASASNTPSTPTRSSKYNKRNGDTGSNNSTPSKSTGKRKYSGLLGGSGSPKPSPTKNASPTKVGTRSTSNTGADNGTLPVLNLRLRNVSGSGVV